MCRHIQNVYDWNIVFCDVKQPIHPTSYHEIHQILKCWIHFMYRRSLFFLHLNYLVSVTAGGTEVPDGTCSHDDLNLIKIANLCVYHAIPFGFKLFRQDVWLLISGFYYNSFGKGLLMRIHYHKGAYGLYRLDTYGYILVKFKLFIILFIGSF